MSASPSPIFILQNSKPITALLFSSLKNDIIYAGNRNGDLTVYDVNLRRSVFSINPNKESILSLIELDENSLLAYCRNGSVFKSSVSNISSTNFKCVYQKESYTFCPFEISYDKKLIYLPSNQASVIDCIESDHFKKVNSSKFKSDTGLEQRGMLMNLKVVGSNQMIAGYENGELVLFDLRSLAEVESINIFKGQPVMCFDFSTQIMTGYAGSAESKLFSFKIDQNKLVLDESVTLVNPGLNCIRIRKSDSKIVATGGWDSRMRIFSTKKRTLLACLDFHKEAINTIDFSMENLIAAGSNDGIISFWKLY